MLLIAYLYFDLKKQQADKSYVRELEIKNHINLVQVWFQVHISSTKRYFSSNMNPVQCLFFSFLL